MPLTQLFIRTGVSGTKELPFIYILSNLYLIAKYKTIDFNYYLAHVKLCIIVTIGLGFDQIIHIRK